MQSSLPQDIAAPTLWLDANNATDEYATATFQGNNVNISLQSVSGIPATKQVDTVPIVDSSYIDSILPIDESITERVSQLNIPTRVLHSLLFSGNTPLDIIQNSTFQNKPIYVFIVSKVHNGTLLESKSGAHNWKINKDCGELKFIVDGPPKIEGGYYSKDCCISLNTFIMNDNHIKIYNNGNLMCLTSAAAGGNSSNTISINCSGNVYELLMYSSALTIAEQQRIEGYLAWKWGCETCLSSEHSMSDSATTQNMDKLAAVISGNTINV